MADQYTIGERVFGKMKGFPPWPAKVMERVGGKEEKYRINFYGTHDESVVKLDQLFRYDSETKAKYGKPQRKAQFKEAMEEIEADIAASEAPESPAHPEEGENAADSEGELTIDEGAASLPPVLTREAIKPENNDNSKSKRPRTLSKRDSVSSVPGTPLVTTPTVSATPEISQTPTNEIVSRSGRKIKPKRFADDEITTPVTAANKAKAAGSEDSGPPPAKRAKRASKSIGSKNATPTTSVPTEEILEKDITPTPAVTTPKSKAGNAKPKAVPNTNLAAAAKQSGRLSPDISAPIVTRGPPSLKPAPVRRGSGTKKLPALIPTSALPKLANTRKSERQTRSKSLEEDENQADVSPAQVEEADDKENSTNKSPADDETVEENGNDESTEAPIVNKKRPVPPAQKASAETKVRIPGKNGLQYELSYDSPPAALNNDELKTWKGVAKENVDKLKEDLLRNEAESQEIINGIADAIQDIDPEEAKSRETRINQIRLLRLEGEVIEIIGEIVGCLNVSSADCDRAMELLERLESHQLNTLMLKKHPEVVATVKKLKFYIGNVDLWEFTPEQKTDFAVKADGIRNKATDVYKHFQDLFCANPEDSFIKVFHDEVEKFKEIISELPMKSVLGLTGIDENGQLQVFDYDLNGDGENDEAMEVAEEA